MGKIKSERFAGPNDPIYTEGVSICTKQSRTKAPAGVSDELVEFLREVADIGVPAWLEKSKARHADICSSMTNSCSLLVSLWHDHRADPGITEVIDKLTDEIIQNWSSFDVEYLFQTYPKDRGLPFEIDDEDLAAYFDIPLTAVATLTAEQRDAYSEHAMDEWMQDPDYDLLGGVQAVTIESSDGRSVAIACEVRGYSFSGVEYSNVAIYSSIEAVWDAYSDQDYYIGPA